MTWIALAVVGLMAASWVAGGLFLRVFADPRPGRSRGQGTARRVLSILVVGTLAAGAISLFAPGRRVSTLPPTEGRMDGLSARRLQQQAAANAVAAAARAGQGALTAERRLNGAEYIAVPPSGPDADESAIESTPGVAVRVARVRSAFPHSAPEKAMADALEVAQVKLVEKLQALNPPVEVVPSIDAIRRDYLRPGSVRDVLPSQEDKDEWRKHDLNESRQWTELDVEVSDSQLRSLRAQQRTTDGGLVAGTALAAFAALFGFLRLDAWTKGYLTTTLAFGAAAVVGGAVALLAWVR